ncbi:F-box domain-containing protein [Favolaschia claudopus]|uniref:F-box domain-containing protein n=1 Tax=Favolaschia claudopus TaxID=2862362 RepID=A0AAW0DTY0_9AGAR
MTSLTTDSARILDIDTEISQFERPVAQLRLENVYPVLSLPNEIVSEIFIHFLPAYPNRPPLTGLRSPTLLTHICAKWRYIALSTHALWRAFTLRFAFNDAQTIQHQIDLAESWLSRSGSYPLSVQIDDSKTEADLPPEESFLAIAAQRGRLEYFGYNNHARENVLLIPGSLTLLRHLDLDLSSAITNKLAVTSEEAPVLRSASLAAFASARVSLPWRQLTSLTLKRVFEIECIQVLQETENLVACELWILPAGLPAAGQADYDIVLPRLHSLVLNGLGPCRLHAWQHPDLFLRCFVTPALRRFETLNCFLGRDPIASVASLISKSACTLEGLCIMHEKERLRLYEPEEKLPHETEELVVRLSDYCHAFPSIPKIFVRLQGDEPDNNAFTYGWHEEDA